MINYWLKQLDSLIVWAENQDQTVLSDLDCLLLHLAKQEANELHSLDLFNDNNKQKLRKMNWSIIPFRYGLEHCIKGLIAEIFACVTFNIHQLNIKSNSTLVLQQTDKQIQMDDIDGYIINPNWTNPITVQIKMSQLKSSNELVIRKRWFDDSRKGFVRLIVSIPDIGRLISMDAAILKLLIDENKEYQTIKPGDYPDQHIIKISDLEYYHKKFDGLVGFLNISTVPLIL